jgi:hypothetical protein
MFDHISVSPVASYGDFRAVLALRAQGYWRWFRNEESAEDALDDLPETTTYIARLPSGQEVGTARTRLIGSDAGRQPALEVSLFAVSPGWRHRRAAKHLLWKAVFSHALAHGCHHVVAVLPEGFERECRSLGLRRVATAEMLEGQFCALPGAEVFSASFLEVRERLRATRNALQRTLLDGKSKNIVLRRHGTSATRAA